MAGQVPEDWGELTYVEVLNLNSWDIVMVRQIDDPQMWAVGDVLTLQMAGTWGSDKYDVYNLKTVPIACMDAQRRWALEHYFDGDYGDSDV